MKKDLTEIVFILDRSGSMDALTADTIGGYNEFLETQKKTSGEAKVTTILFDDRYEILHDGLNIKQILPITSKEYFARGSTALLDAVGMTINDVGARLNRLDESERPEKVIVVIITDGKENASKEFSYKKIQRMITHQQEKYSWEFLFLGANIDAVREAQNLGINANRAANYAATGMGTQDLYNTVAQSIVQFRDCGKITDNLQSEIDKSGSKNKLIN
ncbi:MAG: hypothetical protein H6Q66_1998 [Firmicutes bacterium]|nr:hypothetical protein [Bacillota bacterium]